MDKITEVAGQFVDCIRDERRTPEREASVFFKVLAMAGFEPSRVAPGKLVGHYLEQDGSRTGETYPINTTCLYKVIGQNGSGDYPATGWLDSMVRIAMRIRDREECIVKVRHEIERSIPLDSIQLTAEGDMLEEYPPSRRDERWLVDHARDEDKFGMTAGIHTDCNGWIDRIDTTKTHSTLVCRKCHLRVTFPRHVTTYGALRGTLVFQRAQND